MFYVWSFEEFREHADKEKRTKTDYEWYSACRLGFNVLPDEAVKADDSFPIYIEL